MIALILAGGYGTRLYPLTFNIPKALLKYNNKYYIDYIIEDINKNTNIKNIFILSNNEFYNQFLNYSKKYNNVKIINNHSIKEDNKTAIDNLQYALNYLNDNKCLDDIFVCASDNILMFSIKNFITNFNSDIKIMTYEEYNKEKISKTMIIDKKKLVEKPDIKNLDKKKYNCIPPFYIFNKNIIKDLININLDIKNDSIGKLLEFIINNLNYKIEIYKMPGNRISL